MEKTNIKNKKDGLNIKSKTKKPLRGKKFPIRLSKIKYEEKIVQIKRVTKVVKGGKKWLLELLLLLETQNKK